MTDSIWTTLAGVEYRQRFIDAAGVRTRIMEAGSGTLLILLHGTGGHLETYHRNLGALAEHCHVVAIDMIGHGYTDRPEDIAYDLDDYARHILGVADALGAERFMVSGESLGAWVAAWTAISAPERVSKVVLNTGTLIRPGQEGLDQLKDLETRTGDLVADLTREKVRHRLEWLVDDPATMTDEIVDLRLGIYSRPGMLSTVIRVMAAVQGMVRGTYPKDYFADGVLAGIRCPAMVLWTENNPGQGLREAEKTVEQLDGAEYHVLTNCAHWPQFEDPDQFNKLHLAFIA